MRPVVLAACAAALVSGCGGEDTSTSASSAADPPSGSSECGPAARLVGQRCLAAGVQDNGCVAGEFAAPDGACRAAGVAAEACAAGFDPDPAGPGCRPVLPSDPCGPGTMAIPGEAQCREVAPCGGGTWGDIPVEANTQYVDASYAGADSDGTSARPWTRIGTGVDAAEDGAIVAIADGTYDEDIAITGKAVRLWGRCPAAVSIEGTASSVGTIFVLSSASGSEIHDVAVSGPGIGIAVGSAEGVRIDRTWVHDTGQYGVVATNFNVAKTELTVRGSLVERASIIGIYGLGATLTVDGCVVRDTLPDPADGGLGRGIDVNFDPITKRRASGAVTSSVVLGNRDAGIGIEGSDGSISATVVAGTQPRGSDLTFGRGIAVEPASAGAERGSAIVSACVVSDNCASGIYVDGSDAMIEDTVVRATKPQASDMQFGHGIDLTSDQHVPPTIERTIATVRSCMVEDNHDTGIFVTESDATIAGTVVRGTQPQPSDLSGGRGIEIDENGHGGSEAIIVASVVEASHEVGVFVAGSEAILSGTVVRGTEARASDSEAGYGVAVAYGSERAGVKLSGSVVEDNRYTGVFVSGSDAMIEDTVVRATRAGAAAERHGIGLQVQVSVEASTASTADVRRSLIEDNHYAGLAVLSSDAIVVDTIVRDTAVEPATAGLGDGVSVATYDPSFPATVWIGTSRIERSARAGVSNFGAAVSLSGVMLACNAIQLDGEVHDNVAPSFDDLGSNVCACDTQVSTCKVLSSGLTPPEPPGP